ncbi:hypothetical protein JTE90_022692 [Oedothorax gibbosus]|uniref:Uncharacterized protein n=1 Tax=Oedothorax gibbosus TaxID=931172 RepID=A0AAV6ULQ0_9ARAC|nr:hypothetical protein JTE90_022692 [Oedothorax gibbosus]
MFCGHIITSYEERMKTVFSVCTFKFRETILKTCNTRSELWDVHARILSAIDLPAAEARYHQVRSGNFRNDKPIPAKYGDSRSLPSSVGRPVDNDCSEAFVKTCTWFQENCQEPISVL